MINNFLQVLMHEAILTDFTMLHRRLFIINSFTMTLYLRDKELLALVRLEVILVSVGLLHKGPIVVVLWVHLDILGQDLVGRIHLLTEAVLVETF